jgi:hypothetical protein
MSLQEVKVSREDVLQIVRDNKDKHDGLLKTAIEGYWIDAETFLKKFEKEEVEKYNKSHKQQLKTLRKNRKEYLKSLKTKVKEDLDRVKDRTRAKGFNYWRNNYPEDHGDDYVGTIRRLELSVEPELKLDTHEFDSYILNRWTWKQSFIASNTSYISSWATASYSLSPCSYAVSASWSSGSCLNASYYGTGSVVALANF